MLAVYSFATFGANRAHGPMRETCLRICASTRGSDHIDRVRLPSFSTIFYHLGMGPLVIELEGSLMTVWPRPHQNFSCGPWVPVRLGCGLCWLVGRSFPSLSLLSPFLHFGDPKFELGFFLLSSLSQALCYPSERLSALSGLS